MPSLHSEGRDGRPNAGATRSSSQTGYIVSHNKWTKEPEGSRYLYTMNTNHGTLYNAEGLPASPFILE